MIGRLPLSWRVALLVAVTGAVVLLLSAVAMVVNARTAIKLEVEANRGLARDYVIAAVGSLMRENTPEAVVTFLPGALYQPRHARITVVDRTTGLTHFPEVPSTAERDGEEAPRWFRRLLAPPIQQVVLPIQVGPRIYGDVLITSDPFDEIFEVWQDFRTLSVIGALAYALTLVALVVVVTRTLRPLNQMADVLARLETGDYAARIGSVSVPDLDRLAGHVDQLAVALEHTMGEKDALTRKLVTVQDEERRSVARELHDEFGPCLFGLRVEARAILEEAERSNAAKQVGHARSILEVVEQIQAANRALLGRLRPMTIGQLPLSQVLEDLLESLAGIGGDMTWSRDLSPELGVHDETTDLTAYRIVQEAATNVLRHAGASRIHVEARYTDASGQRIAIRVTDDGKGIEPSHATGAGLQGMKERARSVGGCLSVRSAAGGGSTIEAQIPVASGSAV